VLFRSGRFTRGNTFEVDWKAEGSKLTLEFFYADNAEMTLIEYFERRQRVVPKEVVEVKPLRQELVDHRKQIERVFSDRVKP